MKQQFKALCKNPSDLSNQKEIDSATDAVYETDIKEMVHSPFAAPFRRFEEKNVKMKHKIAQRNHLHLKVAEASGHKGTKANKVPTAKRCDANGGQKCRPKDAPTVGHTTTKQQKKKKAITDYPNPTAAQSREARRKRIKVMDQKKVRYSKKVREMFCKDREQASRII